MDQLSEKKYKGLVLKEKRQSVAREVFAEEQEKDKLLAIAHLKGLVLSIDWEISNSVLGYFTRELNRLKVLWAQERVYLVYLQAMEKLARYIYVEKGEAHPGAIKLLLSLYQNLEQLLVESDWSEEKRRAFLQEDVRRFGLLQEQICYGIVESSPAREREGEKEEYHAQTASFSAAEAPAAEVAETEIAAAGESAVMQADTKANADDIWEEDALPQKPFVAKEIALQGIEVDTEADDGVDEEELPLQDGELAPALADITAEDSQLEVDSEIESTVSSFFGEEEAKDIPEGLTLMLEEEQQESQAEEEKEAPMEELSLELEEEQQGGEVAAPVAQPLIPEDEQEEILQEEFVLEEESPAKESFDDLLSLTESDQNDDEDDEEQLVLAEFDKEREGGFTSDLENDFAENLVEGQVEGEMEDVEVGAEADAIDAIDSIDTIDDFDAAPAVSVSGGEIGQDVALLAEYCEKLSENRDKALLETISSLHDRLLEEMEGRPLELHLLLLFTAVADLLQQRLADDEPVLLLVSIAKTLNEVLSEEDALTAQRLLLRESAAVLDWISSLVE